MPKPNNATWFSLVSAFFLLILSAGSVRAQTPTTTIAAGDTPFAVAVNPVTNKIYVPNQGSNDVTVIDGATNTPTTVAAETLPAAVAVNPVTNKIYVANQTSNDVTVIAEQQVQAIPLQANITPLADNQTGSLTPSFSFTATSTFSPFAPPPQGLFFQVDTWQGAWLAATDQGSGTFSGQTQALQPDFHILYAYSTDGQEATSTITGKQTSPLTSNITAYGFLVSLPSVVLSAASLDFGSLTMNTTSVAQTVTLSNTGGPLTITSITITGPDSGDFAQTNTCGSSVAGGASCTIDVTFTPTALGTRTADLTITSDAASSPDTVSLTGVGLPAPAVSLSSTSLTFGDQLVGTTSTLQMVTLTNTGTAPLTISSLGTTGDFAQTNDCPLSPSTLAEAASCTVSVTFTPTVTGIVVASLSITSDAPGSPHVITFSGTGTQPAVSLSAPSLAFGDQLVSSTSTVQPVTLTNTGTATLNITSITASGDFAQTNDCGASLAASATCLIDVTFMPTATGAATGSVTITDDAPASPHTVVLTGTGTDFALAVQSGGSTSATVSAGQTATYDLQITPTGFSGNVMLACGFQGSTPRGASCSVSAGALTLNGTDPGTFTVNVATTARSLAVPRGPTQPPGTTPSFRYVLLLLISVMTLATVAAASRRRGTPIRTSALQGAPVGVMLLFVMLWATCGGGGGGSPPAPQVGTPAGNYTLTLSATGGGVTKTTNLALRVN